MNESREPFTVPELQGLAIVSFRIDPETKTHTFGLSSGGTVATGALWRLLKSGAIVATSADIGLHDWRQNTVSLEELARSEMTEHLFGVEIQGAEVSVPTGDLILEFASGAALQFLKEHSFLECWEVLSSGIHLLVDASGTVNKW